MPLDAPVKETQQAALLLEGSGIEGNWAKACSPAQRLASFMQGSGDMSTHVHRTSDAPTPWTRPCL